MIEGCRGARRSTSILVLVSMLEMVEVRSFFVEQMIVFITMEASWREIGEADAGAAASVQKGSFAATSFIVAL